MYLLQAQQLTKIYGHHMSLKKALINVSLQVAEGDFLGIMGPSGAGKSTLLNLLSTIDTPTSGKILVSGQDIMHLKGHRLADFRQQQLGFIFQDFNLLDALTVRENIILPLTVKKMPVSKIEVTLKPVAKVLGLTPLLEHYPSELSIGQRQRVASARALIDQPKLLFADEPTGSLDSRSATEFLQYLQMINTQVQTTVIMVTHDAFTASFCKRILFIKDGQIFSQIGRQGDRQNFFERIIDMQATIGGGGKTNALQFGD